MIALCLFVAVAIAESQPEAEADPYYRYSRYRSPRYYSNSPYYYNGPRTYRAYRRPAAFKRYTYRTVSAPYRKPAPLVKAAPAPPPPPPPAPEVQSAFKAVPAVPSDHYVDPAPVSVSVPEPAPPAPRVYEPAPEPVRAVTQTRVYEEPAPRVYSQPAPSLAVSAVRAVPAYNEAPPAVEVVAAAPAGPALAPAPAPAPAPGPTAAVVSVDAPVVSTQYHAQDEFGRVSYGYSNPNSAKTEERDAYGNVVGSYSYLDATGVPKHVAYVADDFGFRVTAANNLPVAPLPIV